jgi:hypothetical protein
MLLCATFILTLTGLFGFGNLAFALIDSEARRQAREHARHQQ